MNKKDKHWICDNCGSIFSANDMYDDDDVGCQQCGDGDISLLCQVEGCANLSTCFYPFPFAGWCCETHYRQLVQQYTEAK